MKILITGISGFIGKELYNKLSKENEVFGLSRTVVNLPNCSTIDFLNKSLLIDYFKNNDFDVIIHLASVMANLNNSKKMSLLLENIEINSNLIEALQNHKSGIFVYFSSSAVYPNVDGEFSENSPTNTFRNADCLYGLSKINGENLFQFLLPSTFKIINLRVGYVYGDNMNENRIHKTFEKELLETNVISIFGNGERIIPQVNIKKLGLIISKFIEHPVEGTYNVAEENVTLVEIAQRIIFEKGNSESKIQIVNKGNKTKFRLNFEKLENYLND